MNLTIEQIERLKAFMESGDDHLADDAAGAIVEYVGECGAAELLHAGAKLSAIGAALVRLGEKQIG